MRRRGRRTRRVVWGIVVVLGGALLFRFVLGGADVRIATWNIREYPESDRQEEAAFETIRDLGLAAVALQEITDTARFEAAARERLGPSWRCAWPRPSPKQHVGVAFDSDVLDLLSTRTYLETMVVGGARPTFEARLRSRDDGDDGEVLRLLVVHLKAGGDGVDIRRMQLLALRPIVKRAVGSGERVVLLGDFNSTSDRDREAIRRLADATGMEWPTEGVECTSYWNRDDGCVGTALDHVLATHEAPDVAARGPCETEGCDRADRCPTFWAEVSDHCPITAE